MIENAIGGLPDRLEPGPRVGVPVLHINSISIGGFIQVELRCVAARWASGGRREVRCAESAISLASSIAR